MSLMVNGPKPGDESYDQYVAEKKEILASLRRRAHMMTVRKPLLPRCRRILFLQRGSATLWLRGRLCLLAPCFM